MFSEEEVDGGGESAYRCGAERVFLDSDAFTAESLREADGLPRVEYNSGRVVAVAGLSEPCFNLAKLNRMFGGSCPGVDPVEYHGVFVEVTDHRGGEVRFQTQVET